MHYRPDIDGLRAIAILLVLIYHGGLSFFPSGFIGVDVFFVISGFLITSIIYTSLDLGTLSFTAFYNRRLWRLQPVFVCLLFLTTALALLFLLPDDLVQYAKSARKCSLFLSNLFFDKVTNSYFSPNSQQLPLLHTWSLSIEWQCYLLLPLLIYCVYRVTPKKYIIALGYGLTLIAFLYSMYNARAFTSHSYYLFSSRVFEFLIGSCVALTPWLSGSTNKYLMHGIGCFSLITLMYVASLQPILAGYPNAYTFAVCLATGFLISLGTVSSQHVLVRMLSSKPLVFIGLLSYSLYIWHWVIFSLIRYQGITETSFTLCIAYGLTFFLAYLSWRFIETPAQKGKHLQFRYTFALLLVAPVVMTHLAFHIIKSNDGFTQRFDGELMAIYQQLERYESKQRAQCLAENQKEISSQCVVGAKKTARKTALMIGDSFSNHYWGFMDVLGQSADVSILMQAVSSCIMLPDIYLYDWWRFKNQIYPLCRQQTEKYYRMIQENHYDYVIIAQLWNNYLADNIINQPGDKRSLALTNQRLERALDKAIAQIIHSGAKPVLIKSNAFMQENVHDCFYKHIKLRTAYTTQECDFKFYENQWFNQLFAKMKIKYQQLILIDPKKVQCTQGTCKADINGVPVYRDLGHLTDYASYQLGTLYLKKYHNPL
ncbi:MAG: acyltransferase family protein [Legionella sp.]